MFRGWLIGIVCLLCAAISGAGADYVVFGRYVCLITPGVMVAVLLHFSFSKTFANGSPSRKFSEYWCVHFSIKRIVLATLGVSTFYLSGVFFFRLFFWNTFYSKEIMANIFQESGELSAQKKQRMTLITTLTHLRLLSQYAEDGDIEDADVATRYREYYDQCWEKMIAVMIGAHDIATLNSSLSDWPFSSGLVESSYSEEARWLEKSVFEEVKRNPERVDDMRDDLMVAAQQRLQKIFPVHIFNFYSSLVGLAGLVLGLAYRGGAAERRMKSLAKSYPYE